MSCKSTLSGEKTKRNYIVQSIVSNNKDIYLTFKLFILPATGNCVSNNNSNNDKHLINNNDPDCVFILSSFI